MKVVIDCNVVVSAARAGGTCGRVIAEAVRNHEIFLSELILHEYMEIAKRPKHTYYSDRLHIIIKEIEYVATMIKPEDVTFGLRDPDDEIYLATAVMGGAAVITGNTKDFTKPRYGPVEILSPRMFIDRHV